MASVTLAESAKLAQDLLVAGVIEGIVTTDRMFEMLPFTAISGNAIAYNRENALGAVGVGGVGDSITTGVTNPIDASTGGKAPATFTHVTSTLTTILGDAEVNGLIQATRSDDTDQTGTQVFSKAKHLGRVYRYMLINGTGAGNQFPGLINLCTPAQTVDTGVNGGPLSFDFLDQLIDRVKAKEGQVDYFTMHSRTLRSYFSLLRALGGAGIGETVTLPSGIQVPGYRGVPIFKNDWIPVDQVKGSGSGQTTVFAGTFDDGTGKVGLSGLTARRSNGIQVKMIGEAEDRDEEITRVKWYCGLALFSELALACADGITN